MILLVDIGNSAIKWACTETFEKLENADIEFYRHTRLSDVLDAKWKKIESPEQILVSNVAGKEIEKDLAQWCQDNWHLEPEYLQVRDNDYGVKLAYQDTSQLGVDRWLAIIAAWNKIQHALCVVDCGTAVTVDGVSESGQHLGGMILPGIELMQQSLLERASGISEIKTMQGKDQLANNTQQGIASGTTMAVVAMVDRVVKNMQKDFDTNLACIITGGSAMNILHLTESQFEHDPHLVLHGLAWTGKQKI